MVVLTSFPHPTQGVRLEQCNTVAHMNDSYLGKGTLYIAESRLYWICSTGYGFSLEYPHISLHAISRDTNAFPEDCLFLMLDSAINGNQDDQETDDPDCQGTTELRFIPEDKGMLDAMFHAMSACQALHPDPEDSFSDEDFYEDADETIPVDETNSQMANLCIAQNRSVYTNVGNGFGTMGSREDGTAVDRVTDGAVNRVAAAGMEEHDVQHSAEEDRVAAAAADIEEHRVLYSAEEDKVSDMEEDRVSDMEEHSVLYSAEEDRVSDMAVDMQVDMQMGHTQSSFEHRRFYSSHNRQAEDCSSEGDTDGCFDDAEN